MRLVQINQPTSLIQKQWKCCFTGMKNFSWKIQSLWKGNWPMWESWGKIYDFCLAIHPLWSGYYKESFSEWVIAKPKNCKIYEEWVQILSEAWVLWNYPKNQKWKNLRKYIISFKIFNLLKFQDSKKKIFIFMFFKLHYNKIRSSTPFLSLFLLVLFYLYYPVIWFQKKKKID